MIKVLSKEHDFMLLFYYIIAKLNVTFHVVKLTPTRQVT